VSSDVTLDPFVGDSHDLDDASAGRWRCERIIGRVRHDVIAPACRAAIEA
jgi:hypothetical protein